MEGLATQIVTILGPLHEKFPYQDIFSNIMADLGTSLIQWMFSWCGGTVEVRDLEQTKKMIQARLNDAERRSEGENGDVIKEWLKELKTVLYKLQDLIEELKLAALEDEQKLVQLGGNPPKRLRTLSPFSWSSSCSSLKKAEKKAALKAKDIMEQLEKITTRMNELQLNVVPVEEPRLISLARNRDSYSFIVEGKLVGRDEDKTEILKRVSDSDNAQETVSVIPIYGIGGLGKTTLARLVFNDDDIKRKFNMRYWVLISVSCSLKEIVRKILQAIISNGDCQNLSMEMLTIRLQRAVRNKKFLLVLDDVWNEEKEMWDELKSLLQVGKKGSKIIVTSRSSVVARNMGTVEPYELKGLPDDKSRELFWRVALEEGHERRSPNREIIGREIVKKCANVPLVIKNIASLLQYMDTDKEWERFEQRELRRIKDGEGEESSILMTLKLSYYRLPLNLKQCFAYCSVFPKGHVFVKEAVISLWMAQGFLGSCHGDGIPEYEGHSYFMQLVRRCFFQDVVRDCYGEIISCKMHDLVYDLAKDVAKEETLSIVDGFKPDSISENIWHVSFSSTGSSVKDLSRLLDIKQMRSLLLLSAPAGVNLNTVFSRLTCLRALDLGSLDCKSLPSSLQKLKHFRYLRIASSLEYLPECITRLRNLQTLDIRGCHQLKELPKGFSKLVNLRNLRYGDRQWDDLPPEFKKLSFLRTLDKFIVGKNNRLDALASLKNLAGDLKICIAGHCGNSTAGILKDKKLTSLKIEWSSSCEESVDAAESELSSLEPNLYLKKLSIARWEGTRFPSWGMNELSSLLPCLISVEIEDCRNCHDLPPFSQLPYLESLSLRGLHALEYIEISQNDDRASSATSTTLYFESLKTLEMRNLPELKYWCSKPSFPRLSKLIIEDCPKLKSMPLTPKLESLEAKSIHENLLRRILYAEEDDTASPSSSLSTLRSLRIRSVQQLESLSINMCSLEELEIRGCAELTILIVHSQMPLLRQLSIANCIKLRDISHALQHLSNLEELKIKDCKELYIGDIMSTDEDDDDDGELTYWQGLKSLRSLKLWAIPNLNSQSLMGISCMSSTLCELSILNCPQLKQLPQSFRKLTSLQKLWIRGCPDQENGCQQRTGQDRDLIEHIPQIQIGWSPSSV